MEKCPFTNDNCISNCKLYNDGQCAFSKIAEKLEKQNETNETIKDAISSIANTIYNKG
ncbi:MAG: hypothetical protein SPH07_03170 [Eubacteriales bacterium]|nr:hypothetical protein [Eubacteriales bacterium]